MIDQIDFGKPTFKCARTGRSLLPGEVCFSVLLRENLEFRRLDFSEEAWTGPPETAVAWWKFRVPAEHKPSQSRLRPNELLQIFERLLNRNEQAELAYLLGLLLVRKRVLRIENQILEGGQEFLLLYCPRRECEYRVHVPAISDERMAALEQLLLAITEGRVVNE